MQWIRISTLVPRAPRVFVGNLLKGKIVPGALADDWFLGALAVRPALPIQHITF